MSRPSCCSLDSGADNFQAFMRTHLRSAVRHGLGPHILLWEPPLAQTRLVHCLPASVRQSCNTSQHAGCDLPTSCVSSSAVRGRFREKGDLTSRHKRLFVSVTQKISRILNYSNRVSTSLSTLCRQYGSSRRSFSRSPTRYQRCQRLLRPTRWLHSGSLHPPPPNDILG